MARRDEPMHWGPGGPCFVGVLNGANWARTEEYLDRDKFPGIKIIYPIIAPPRELPGTIHEATEQSA